MVVSLALSMLLMKSPVASADRAAQDEGGGPSPFTSQSVERVSLPPLRGKVALRFSALSATVELVAPQDAKAIAKKLIRDPSELCPDFKMQGHVVTLRCQTRRFDAALVQDAKSHHHLELRTLRGIPSSRAAGSAVELAYPPERVGLGGSCPGTTLAGKGECERIAGHLAEATRLFTQALETADSPAAALRLGDIALQQNDPVAAASWFQRAGTKGAFGRMAMARLCELTGSCLSAQNPTKLFDAVALPEPLRTELELRAIRVDAFLGKLSEAARALAARLSDETREVQACVEAAPLCVALLIPALKDSDLKTKAEALEAYLQIRAQDEGNPALRPLTRAAADAAQAVGAPQYAANLLASLTQHVAANELEEHLLKTAEMYLEAGDSVRAGVIIDFAKARLGAKRVSSRAWRSLKVATADVKGKESERDTAFLNEIASDRQHAEDLLAKSRALTSLGGR